MKSDWPETSGASSKVDLREDGVHVWTVPLESEAAALRSLEEQLAPDERLRASRFLREKPRRDFIASRAALRVILGHYLGVLPAEVAIAYDSTGKPRLADAAAARGVRFNLAHSGDLGLVAVTQGCEIGVDIELLRPVEHWRQIAGRYFHPVETEAILAAAPAEQDEAFLRCWTRKEAILKASGAGLGHSLDSFAVPLNANLCAWVDLPAAADSASAPSRFWLQSLAASSGYVAAVATTIKKPEATGFAYSG